MPRTPLTHDERTARAMSEEQLLDAVLGTPKRPGVARVYGWLGYHTRRSQHSPAGFPDLALVRRDRLVFAELKRQTGSNPTPDQLEWLDALRVVADAVYAHTAPITSSVRRLEVHLWRPLDLIDGTIVRVLR